MLPVIEWQKIYYRSAMMALPRDEDEGSGQDYGSLPDHSGSFIASVSSSAKSSSGGNSSSDPAESGATTDSSMLSPRSGNFLLVLYFSFVVFFWFFFWFFFVLFFVLVSFFLSFV